MRSQTLFISLFTACTLAGCGAAGDASDPVAKKKIIKLSHSHQEDFNSELHLSAWIFQQWVNSHSDTLEVRLYPANTLGQERDVYEGMQLGGGATCAISGTAILNNFCPKVAVLDLPFLWRDYDHVHRVLDGPVGETLAGELSERGFHVLAWMDSWGYRNIVTADKPVRRSEDLKGLKIRTIQTPVYTAALNAMGADATAMAFGEVYTSLQMGVLDGFEHSASVIKANNFQEVAHHIALTRHLFGPLAFVYSKAEWDKLTEQEQQVVLEGARMARDIQRALAPVREGEALAWLAAHGMTITDIDTRDFEAEARRVQDRLVAEQGATDLLAQIRAQ